MRYSLTIQTPHQRPLEFFNEVLGLMNKAKLDWFVCSDISPASKISA